MNGGGRSLRNASASSLSSRSPAVLLSVVACAVVLLPASAAAADIFRTPGNAALCRATHNDLEIVWNTLLRSLTCVTPNDGFYVRMTGLYGKRPQVTKGYRASYKGMGVETGTQLLGFGQTWDPFGIGIVRCVSRSTGLTCDHPLSGRGWWLGRFRGYRIF